MEKKIFLISGLLCLYVSVFCFTPPFLLQPENQVKNLPQNKTFSWVTNNDFQNYELKINECDYEASSYTNSINLGDYELLREKEISAALKGGGLTWAEGFSQPLVLCADEFYQIDAYRNSLTGRMINRLFGFKDFAKNYKGITHLYNDHYGLIDEATGKLIYFDFIPQTFANITYPLTPKYDLNINISNINQGIEGIAYNQFNNSMYVAKEKSPMQLFEFKAAVSPDFATSPGNLTQPFNLESAARNWNIKNVSGLFHLSKSSKLNGTKASNNLLVLSNESYALIECDLKGNKISSMSLNAGGANGTLSKAVANAQGIAYGNGIIHILTSAIPEKGIPAKFYTFSNKNYKESTTVIGNPIFTKSNIRSGSYTASNLNIDNNKTYCWNINGTNINGQKYSSNYYSFGETAVKPTEPVIEKTISLKTPLLNTVYKPGETVDIQWEQNVNFKVNVYFYKGTTPVRTPGLRFEGRRLQFKIPSNTLTGNNFSIKIAFADDESKYASTAIRVNADFIPIGQEVVDENGTNGPTGNPSIQISSPSIGQSYLPQSIIPIKWAFNRNEKVTISLKSNTNETHEIEKEYINTGSYNFKVPFIPKSSEYYIEIRSASNNTVVSTSGKFTITSKQGIKNVKLSNGYLGNTQKYLPGDDIVLTWDDQISGDVIIQLYDKTRWVAGFTGVTKSDGYEKIILKSNLPLDYRIDYRIRVISKDDNKVFAYSEPFKIASHKAFNFIVPISTTYNSKNMLVVRWSQLLNNVSGLDRVKLTLMQQNKTVKQIIGNTNNDGLFYWFPNVPDGSNYRIFMESTTNPGLVSSSLYFSFENGQAKLMQKPDLVVSPNPASDFVDISFNKNLDGITNLKLYAANGACLKDITLVEEQHLKLDVSTLKAGFYFLNVSTKEYTVNKKILIE